MKALIRWVLFIFVGIPTQAVVMVIYPLVHLYWKFFVYKKVEQTKAVHDFSIPPTEGNSLRVGNSLLDNVDDHGAFTMYGFIGARGLMNLLDNDGNFLRRFEDVKPDNQNWVSGDVVTAWTFANVVSPGEQVDTLILEAADQYLKNLGTLSFDTKNNGDVSNRCNNFGINYCPDSDALKMGQPMAGPQFYTSSALFALASQYSNFYKVIFWSHWIILGGWYWAFSPMIHSKEKRLGYVRDMTMKALYVHLQVFGPKWWIIKPMEKITYQINTCQNDLHRAMLGIDPPALPECMDAFFSQKEHGGSRRTDRMSAFIPAAIRTIALQSKARK
jgi:hypothetical protein